MLRLLLFTIVAMMTVTSIVGLPTVVPIQYKDLLFEMHRDFEGNRMIQRQLEKLIGVILMGDGGTVAAKILGDAAIHGAVGVPTTTTDANDDHTSQPCTGEILLSHVQDIQFHQSNLQYIIINGQLISKPVTFDLFFELYQVVRQIAGSTTVIDVWFSHVPCAACITYLDLIFGPFAVKPVLHIESLQYKGTNYKTLRDIGCLAKLRTRNYQLKAWDWDVFRTKHDSCDYYSASKSNTEYTTKRIYTEKFMNFFEGNFTNSSLAELCDL